MDRNVISPFRLGKLLVQRIAFVFGVLTLLFPSTIMAMEPAASFREVAQTADLIFVGTVQSQSCRYGNNGKIIFTDVVFEDIGVLSGTDRSVSKNKNEITLTYAGGKVGDLALEVSDSPHFEDGKRYLLCVLDDGQTYLSPIVSLSKGFFQVQKDDTTKKEYLTNAGGKLLLNAQEGELLFSQDRLAKINNGVAEYTKHSGAQEGLMTDLPKTGDIGGKSTQGGKNIEAQKLASNPMTLETFKQFLAEDALVKKPEKRVLRRGDSEGKFYREKDGEVIEEEIEITPPVQESPPEEKEEIRESSNSESKTTGGSLGACGYHDLYLVMEQVPANWWSYPIHNDSMWVWNQFMDIYRVTQSDGGVGNNSDNEFAGWMDNATLGNIYGSSWGTAIAKCFSWFYSECGELDQSDVVYNSAYSWTDSESYAIGNSSVVLLLPVTNHELGHTWGYQRGSYNESYDYDVLTVMHSYYSDIVENGRGIHRACAYLIRRIYDAQILILPYTDAGVESYYASNGLKNSTFSKTNLTLGEQFTFQNVTVENMSTHAINNLRIRFYLSSNRTISTSDRLVGEWYWTTFNAESYTVGNFQTWIPGDLPSGTWYGGAIVTINGYGSDSYGSNNTTSLFGTINVTNDPPYRPSPIIPANGTTGLDLTPLLWASNFVDPNAHAHQNSQWQVDTSSSFSSPEWDSGLYWQPSVTAIVPAGRLAYDTRYYWRVRYKDEFGAWSPWSNQYTTAWWFRTMDAPNIKLSDKTITVREGTTGDFSVWLDSAPSGTAVVSVYTRGRTVLSFDPSQITFGETMYSRGRVVEVSAAEDIDTDDENIQVFVGSPGMDVVSLTVQVLDNDTVQPTPTPGYPPGWGEGDFNNDNCTDINDFLWLLDHWQQNVDGYLVDINVLLNLLDHWQTGDC